MIIGTIASGCDSAVQSTVQAIRRCDRTVPVLIGGAAINDAGHAGRLGADAWTGPDGRSVIAAVNDAARTVGRARSGPGRAVGSGDVVESPLDEAAGPAQVGRTGAGISAQPAGDPLP